MIRKLTILNPDKRDGGLYSAFCYDSGEIICKQEDVMKNCYDQLSKFFEY